MSINLQLSIIIVQLSLLIGIVAGALRGKR